MELFITFIFIPAFVLAFAILANLYREHRHTHFELKPNCLLTRKPVVFVTGPRSVFYFRKYWNAYPEVLAEHGYQVFTLPLPWRGKERFHRMQEYLTTHAELGKSYHLICDHYTSQELRSLLNSSPAVASLTILEDHSLDSNHTLPSRLLDLSYRLHRWTYLSLRLPLATDLGLHSPTSTAWLLQKMQEKGEQDFLT